MFTEQEVDLLKQVAAILERAHNAPIPGLDYMDGWRTGRAEMAAETAARDIRTAIWLTRDRNRVVAS